MFHVSKEFIPDCSPMFATLAELPALDLVDLTLEKILDRQLVKKGNMAVVQILVVVGAARIIGHLERSQCSSCKVFISSSLGTGYVFRRDHLGGNGLNLTREFHWPEERSKGLLTAVHED
jgi:hypothetical protein